MRTIEQMISSEVLCCMSSLVATLANGTALTFSDRAAMRSSTGAELMDLAQQAFELASPIDDWEEAAIQAGWRFDPESDIWFEPFTDWKDGSDITFRTAADLCRANDIEPYASEIFEHWAVADWFADKLEAAGEKVDKDFGGLAIWARTTTGQAIYADAVIERIYAETHTGSEG